MFNKSNSIRLSCATYPTNVKLRVDLQKEINIIEQIQMCQMVREALNTWYYVR